MNTITLLTPSRNDFPEDFTPEALSKGFFSNTCRECGATIGGAEHRRTCAGCVEIFKKKAAQNRQEWQKDFHQDFRK